MTGNVFAIQRYSLHDGAGIRTTVFLKGCPLSCVWCHNPESKSPRSQLLFDAEKCTSCGLCVQACQSGAREVRDDRLEFDRTSCTVCARCVTVCPTSANEVKGEPLDVDDVIREVVKDKIFYDSSGGGMTLSGGEPSMQPEFALALIDAAVAEHIDCALETCGSGSDKFYRETAARGVRFLYDLKALDDTKHTKYCGVSNRRILENLSLLFSLGADVTLRLPMIPGYNDSEQDLYLLKSFLDAHAGQFVRAELLPYHNLGTAKERRLGLEPRDIPNGEDFTERWLDALGGSGYEIQLSNS